MTIRFVYEISLRKETCIIINIIRGMSYEEIIDNAQTREINANTIVGYPRCIGNRFGTSYLVYGSDEILKF